MPTNAIKSLSERLLLLTFYLLGEARYCVSKPRESLFVIKEIFTLQKIQNVQMALSLLLKTFLRFMKGSFEDTASILLGLQGGLERRESLEDKERKSPDKKRMLF